jgi:hypothetical protein
MRLVKKSIFIILSFTVIQSSYAWPELPFCPSGGPSGWMNYFNYKRDQNNWQHQINQQYYPYQYSRGYNYNMAYPYNSLNHLQTPTYRKPLIQRQQFNASPILNQRN